jgi:hypothetical protein
MGLGEYANVGLNSHGTVVGRAVIQLVGDNSQLKKDLGEAKAEGQATTSAMSKGSALMATASKVAWGALGAAAVYGAGKALSAASDLNEQMNVTQVTFGDAAQSVIDFSKQTSNLGLSSEEALMAASAFGNMAEAAGASQEKAASMGTTMVQLASDMGSFFNVDPSEMLQRLRAGLAGSAEVLRPYGVLIDDVTVSQRAMSMGLASNTSELTSADKMMARYQIILEQTGNAQGDFARTLGTSLPNQMRVLRGELTNTLAVMGKSMLPVALSAVKAFRGLIGVLQPIAPYFTQIAVALGAYKLFSSIPDIINGLAKAFTFLGETDIATKLRETAAAMDGTTASAAGATAANENLAASEATAGEAAGAAAADEQAKVAADTEITTSSGAAAEAMGAEQVALFNVGGEALAASGQLALFSDANYAGVSSSEAAVAALQGQQAAIVGVGDASKAASLTAGVSFASIAGAVAIAGVAIFAAYQKIEQYKKSLDDIQTSSQGILESGKVSIPQYQQITQNATPSLGDTVSQHMSSPVDVPGLVGGVLAYKGNVDAYNAETKSIEAYKQELHDTVQVQMETVGANDALTQSVEYSGTATIDQRQKLAELVTQYHVANDSLTGLNQGYVDGLVSSNKWAEAIAYVTQKLNDQNTALQQAAVDQKTTTAQQVNTVSHFASVTGASYNDIISQAKALAAQGGTNSQDFQKFLDDQVQAVQQWHDSLISNFDGVSTALSGLAGQGKQTGQDIADAVKHQIAIQKTWGDNFRIVQQRAKAMGIDATTYLSEASTAGLTFGNVLKGTAQSSDKNFATIVNGANKSQQGAQSLADMVQNKLVGSIHNLIAAIKGIPNWTNTNIKADTSSAENSVSTLKNHLTQLGLTPFQATVLVHYRNDGRAPHHAGGYIHGPLMHAGGDTTDLKADEVPIIAQRGEFVINRTSASRLGPAVLHTLNRYHDGGQIVSPEVLRSLARSQNGPIARDHSWGSVVVNVPQRDDSQLVKALAGMRQEERPSVTVNVAGKVERPEDIERGLDWWARSSGW